jgi:hypothetical protein
MATDQDGAFKGRHFTFEVILWALRWYLAFPISYRDLAVMASDRGVLVDHTTLFRWIQAYAATLERRARCHLRPCTGPWRLDETYKGVWTDLYRAVAQPRADDRLPALGSVGRRCGRTLLPQSAGPTAHGEPEDDHSRQEPGLPACGGGHEASG